MRRAVIALLARRNRRAWMATLAVGLIGSLGVAGCGGDDSGGEAAGGGGGGEPYKIGVALSLTGPAASFGTTQRDTFQALVDDLNAKGGVGGRKVELVVEDTKSDPTEAARVGTKLIREEQVLAIFGDTTSGGTLAFLPDAGRQGVAVLTPGSDAELIDPESDSFKTTFMIPQTVQSDNQVVLEQMAKNQDRRVGVIYAEDAVYVAGAKLFKQQAAEAGVEIVEQVSVAPDATDVSAQAQRVAQADPDAIYMMTSAVAVADSLLGALKDRRYDGSLYGTAGTVQSALTEGAGGAAEGFIAPALVNPDDASARPRLQELMKPLGGVKNHGNFTAAQAFAVLQAGLEAKPADGAAFAAAVEKAGPIEGYAAAPVEYSAEDHQGLGPEGLVVVQVKDGKFETLDQ